MEQRLFGEKCWETHDGGEASRAGPDKLCEALGIWVLS